MDQNRPRRRSTRVLALAVAGLAAMSITSGAMSLALFTDQETDASTVTAGTIVLDAIEIDALDLTATNIVPGEAVTSHVNVQNDGTHSLRYSLSSTATSVAGANGGVLNTALTVEVREDDLDGTCALFNGASIVAAETLGASNAIFGNPLPDDGTGDRAVAVGATDALCIRLALPSTAGDTFQGAASTATFTFDAEQN